MKLNKSVIGMVHLKALPNAPLAALSLDEIVSFAKQDLLSLQEAGVDGVIVENYFDYPYNVEVDKATLIGYAYVYSQLKAIATIPLGVNLQYSFNEDEMMMASLLGAEFIRAETFVEKRCGSFGEQYPSAAKIMRYKRQANSKVQVFADINVKHSFPANAQTIEYSISEAVANNADALIVTGLKTGENPSIDDVKHIKSLAKTTPVLIGSGITSENIAKYLEYADGVIVGSAIKADGKVENPVDKARVKELISKIKK